MQSTHEWDPVEGRDNVLVRSEPNERKGRLPLAWTSRLGVVLVAVGPNATRSECMMTERSITNGVHRLARLRTRT